MTTKRQYEQLLADANAEIVGLQKALAKATEPSQNTSAPMTATPRQVLPEDAIVAVLCVVQMLDNLAEATIVRNGAGIKAYHDLANEAFTLRHSITPFIEDRYRQGVRFDVDHNALATELYERLSG